MNNLFLTGEIQVGKSTLLRKLLEKSGLRAGGVETGFGPWRAEKERSLFLHPYGQPDYSPAAVCCRMGPRGKTVYPEVFDGRGAALIRAALGDPAVEVIVLDELGCLEAEAREFRAAVLEALASPKPVWGVLRLGGGCWGDADLGKIVTVTRENRDMLAEKLWSQDTAVFPG